MTERAPEMPVGGIGTELSPAGHGFLEGIANKVKELDERLSNEEGGSALGELSSKDEVSPAELSDDFATVLLQARLVDESTAYHTCAATIPVGGVTPAITDGDEILSGSYTPKSATSSLVISVIAYAGVNQANARHVGMALFAGSTCIAASMNTIPASTAYHIANIRYAYSPGSTDPIAFSVRIGADSGTMYVNGNSGGANYPGLMRTCVTVEEYEQRAS